MRATHLRRLLGAGAAAAFLGGAAPVVWLSGCSSSSGTTPPPEDAGSEHVALPDASDAGDSGAIHVDAGSHPDDIGPGCGDRAGRAAVAFALIPAASPGPTDGGKADGSCPECNPRDEYNRVNPFALGPASSCPGLTALQVQAYFQQALVSLDQLGGDPVDWMSASNAHPLVTPLSIDALLVDTSKPFSPTGYLEIEYTTFALGMPGTHVSCGGRWLGDDAVDKTLSFFVKKTLSGVSDNVSSATKAPSTTFPYLAPPN